LQQLFGVLTAESPAILDNLRDPAKKQYVPPRAQSAQPSSRIRDSMPLIPGACRPTFTLTYGLRWEYQGSPYDQLNESFSLVNGFSDVFGVSGPNNLFKPGR